jgi:hypothetical protein
MACPHADGDLLSSGVSSWQSKLFVIRKDSSLCEFMPMTCSIRGAFIHV